MYKRCNMCNINKSINDFYRDKSRKDGHSNRCKECTKKYLREYYKKNRVGIIDRVKEYAHNNREKISIRNSERFQKNKDKIRELHKIYRKQHVEENKLYQKKYCQSAGGKLQRNKISKEMRNKYPEKYKARRAVNHAIEAGKMKSAKSFICKICNEKPAEHYHHYNGYDNTHRFDAIPVCGTCHNIVDKQH
jgi:hypothetical protein